jgi:hypothetical protein
MVSHKQSWILFIAVLIIIVIAVPWAVFSSVNQVAKPTDKFFFGITYGQDTVEGAKVLIDKVYSYTNVFVVDSSVISTNESALNAVCNYAASKNLCFFVYFFSLYSSSWQQEWVVNANQTWGDKFLGVYLRDEPGGRQIETAETVANASSYSEASEKYVQTVSSTLSMKFLKANKVPAVTSDFALYWFNYKAGFDTIFAEFGWNNSRAQEIALCRGAATMQGKSWGTIITWTYMQPPYIESAQQTYQDMTQSYQAGAKYILIFDYPVYPDGNQYGILTEEHFMAMQQFWNYASTHPRDSASAQVEAAFVLPENYGWGMRSANDLIWGLWSADNSSSGNMAKHEPPA